jgi:hypothetical protein
MARDLGHVLDCGWIHPSDGEIQVNATKDIHPWHGLASEVSGSGCLHIVILNHNGTHALFLSKTSKVDSIHRTRETVRTYVSMKVDSA